MCDEIIEFKPDLVVTEKGVSDLAQHYLLKANVSVIRRVRKTDNNRIARACGATIVHRTSELTEKDIGTGCGLFEVKKIGDEYFTWVVDCEAPKACTILLRGASKDVLNEIERNLGDAMNVVRTIYQVSPMHHICIYMYAHHLPGIYVWGIPTLPHASQYAPLLATPP